MSIWILSANASLLPNVILKKYLRPQAFEDFTGQHKILST